MPKRKNKTKHAAPRQGRPLVMRSGDIQTPIASTPQTIAKPKASISKQTKMKIAGAVVGSAAIAAAGIGIGMAIHKHNKKAKQPPPKLDFDTNTAITPRNSVNSAAIFNTTTHRDIPLHEQYPQDPSWDDWDGGDIPDMEPMSASHRYPEIGSSTIYLDSNNIYA